MNKFYRLHKEYYMNYNQYSRKKAMLNRKPLYFLSLQDNLKTVDLGMLAGTKIFCLTKS